jgi:hypothetical protein
MSGCANMGSNAGEGAVPLSDLLQNVKEQVSYFDYYQRNVGKPIAVPMCSGSKSDSMDAKANVSAHLQFEISSVEVKYLAQNSNQGAVSIGIKTDGSTPVSAGGGINLTKTVSVQGVYVLYPPKHAADDEIDRYYQDVGFDPNAINDGKHQLALSLENMRESVLSLRTKLPCFNTTSAAAPDSLVYTYQIDKDGNLALGFLVASTTAEAKRENQNTITVHFGPASTKN